MSKRRTGTPPDERAHALAPECRAPEAPAQWSLIVSAVPSGSAGEPTPTDAHGEQHDAATTYHDVRAENMASDAHGAASRLAALRQHPEVRLRLNEVLWYGKNLGLPTGTVCEGGRTWRETFDSEVDALLSAVAAAATAQTLERAATLLDGASDKQIEMAEGEEHDARYPHCFAAGLLTGYAYLLRGLADGAPAGETTDA
jgi:hypothetical protein